MNALDDALDTDASGLTLPGGSPLVKTGERAEALYRLVAGRLTEVEQTANGGERVVAILRPGALIGAAQLLGDGIFRTTITALRDSDLIFIPADRAQALMNENPGFLAEVARASLLRLWGPDVVERRKSSILGFVAVCDGIHMRDLVERVAAGMRRLGLKVAVLGAEAQNSPPSRLSSLEAENDYVLLAAERREPAFAAFCGRQIDRLILVAGAASAVPEQPIAFAAAAIEHHRLLDLILVQPTDSTRPVNSERWLSIAPASRLFQVRDGDALDIARLARVFSGKSVGLALSGGGARAYAHVGVARALTELGVPVDFLAGTSMGAVIAAGLAMGWDGVELDRRIREAFVDSSPLSDIALPLLAMTRGRMVDRRLKQHFGDTEISDLWRPFVCASTDLTSGTPHVHRRGLVRSALRASLSLPGVLPPVVLDGHVLVDGALVRNLPTDLARDMHDGVTIGVDVAVSEALRPEDLLLRPSGWRWLTSGAWRKGPPIVAVLIRSATLPSAAATSSDVDAATVQIVPQLDGVELQDWAAYEPAVEAGYRAAIDAAPTLEKLRL